MLAHWELKTFSLRLHLWECLLNKSQQQTYEKCSELNMVMINFIFSDSSKFCSNFRSMNNFIYQKIFFGKWIEWVLNHCFEECNRKNWEKHLTFEETWREKSIKTGKRWKSLEELADVLLNQNWKALFRNFSIFFVDTHTGG